MSENKQDRAASDFQALIQTFQFIALAFTITTPCLLIAGYSYYLGYINTFGIDSSLLNRDFSEAITECWIVGLKLLVYLWEHKHYPAYWALGVIVLALYCMAIIIKRKKLGLSNILVDGSLNKENQGSVFFGLSLYHWGLLCEFIYLPLKIVVEIIGIIALALLTSAIPFNDGTTDANEKIDNYRTHQCNRNVSSKISNCISLVSLSEDKRILTEGILVTASKTHIAIYSNNQTEIWPIRDDYKLATNYQPKVAQKTEE